MLYRKMQKSGAVTSLLGFGCMRLPVLKDGNIDKELARTMIYRAREQGVNYFDTAYTYHNGESEKFLGEVLSEFPRDSFYLTDKMPVWDQVKTLDDAKHVFQEQLARCRVDYFDNYLVHSLNNFSWAKMEALSVPDYLEEEKKRGRIRNLGFSFHDDYPTFERILTSRGWDLCQIQFNYMDYDQQAGLKGIELARKLGVPIVVMEPVKGGNLIRLPDEAKRIFEETNPSASIASWALRYVAEFEDVKVILSGMSDMQQVQDNLNTFEKAWSLRPEEAEAISAVREVMRARTRNGCTGCRYCMPCSKGVNISRCFELWNNYGRFGNVKQTTADYFVWLVGKHADECVGCGACEKKCPQGISIRKDLHKLTEEFERLKG